MAPSSARVSRRPQKKNATMIDINNTSHRGLDELAERSDAAQGQAVLRKVYDFLGRFVSYPCEYSRTAHALWIVHSHLMDIWESTPRIAFLSAEPSSGKTRALEVTELLVPRPVAAVNVSPAYLFRKIGAEEGVPTILYDEIDTVFGPKAKENEEIRALLNAGHRKGAVAGRCVVHGKTVKTEEIPAYSAVALAGIGWLPDTILSRSVIIRMRRRKVGERIEPFRRRIHEAAGVQVRRQIELWARACADSLILPEPDELPPAIQDRDADVWESLIAIADAAGGEWPGLARKAAVALVAVSKEAEASLGVLLLIHVKAVFGDAEQLSTDVLLHRLQEIDEAPWSDLKGKPLNDRGLASRLRQYGIRPQTIRIDGETTRRGYRRQDFLDVWSRYVDTPPPSSATSETSETSDTTQCFRRETVSDAVSDVSDAGPTTSQQNSRKISPVLDVSLVSDLPEHRGEGRRLCVQCHGDEGAPPTIHRGVGYPPEGVWLHKQCERFWLKEHPAAPNGDRADDRWADYPDFPPSLRRAARG
jgi:hypothetical protein